MNLTCDNVEFIAKEDDTHLRLESSAIQGQSGMAGEAVNFTFLTRFERFSTDREAFGPFVFEIEFRRLDAATLAKFQQDLKNLSNMVSTTPEEEMKQLLESCYTKLLTELIAKSPEMEIKQLKMRTSKGDLFSKLRISLAQTGVSILDNPLLALNGLSADLDFSVSESLFVSLAESGYGSSSSKDSEQDRAIAQKLAAQKARNTLSTLLAEKILVSDKGSLKANASFASGKLVINGRKLGIADLFKPGS